MYILTKVSKNSSKPVRTDESSTGRAVSAETFSWSDRCAQMNSGLGTGEEKGARTC